mmetsp:Transcript_36335/g.58741  ORF Transcript_36335/g.58741 Transcript_36335/m.58741 type:complete len:232 (-) Transcript_36335:1395-2090(-)
MHRLSLHPVCCHHQPHYPQTIATLLLPQGPWHVSPLVLWSLLYPVSAMASVLKGQSRGYQQRWIQTPMVRHHSRVALADICNLPMTSAVSVLLVRPAQKAPPVLSGPKPPPQAAPYKAAADKIAAYIKGHRNAEARETCCVDLICKVPVACPLLCSLVHVPFPKLKGQLCRKISLLADWRPLDYAQLSIARNLTTKCLVARCATGFLPKLLVSTKHFSLSLNARSRFQVLR